METVKTSNEVEYLLGTIIEKRFIRWYGEPTKIKFVTTLTKLFYGVKNELIQFEQKYYGSAGIGTKDEAGFIWGDIYYFYADGKLLFSHKCDNNFCRCMDDERVLEYLQS